MCPPACPSAETSLESLAKCHNNTPWSACSCLFIIQAIPLPLNVGYRLANPATFTSNEIVTSQQHFTSQHENNPLGMRVYDAVLILTLADRVATLQHTGTCPVLATPHPLAKLGTAGCPHCRNRSVQPLGLGREHVQGEAVSPEEFCVTAGGGRPEKM